MAGVFCRTGRKILFRRSFVRRKSYIPPVGPPGRFCRPEKSAFRRIIKKEWPRFWCGASPDRRKTHLKQVGKRHRSDFYNPAHRSEGYKTAHAAFALRHTEWRTGLSRSYRQKHRLWHNFAAQTVGFDFELYGTPVQLIDYPTDNALAAGINDAFNDIFVWHGFIP